MSDPETTRKAPGAATTSEPTVESGPPDQAHDDDLVRWTLSLSVEERLAVLQDFVDTFWTPQHG